MFFTNPESTIFFHERTRPSWPLPVGRGHFGRFLGFSDFSKGFPFEIMKIKVVSMISNFERKSKKKQILKVTALYAMWNPDLPRSPYLWPRWSDPFMFQGCKISFFAMINSYIGIFYLKKTLLSCRKTKQRNFFEILFVDS